MIQIHKNASLKKYNTFGLEAKATYLAHCASADELKQALTLANEKQLPILILGGGSNMLFTKDFEGVVIHPVMQQITVLEENTELILLEAQAGVVWDDLVAYTVDNEWHGLENLSYIPGHVGACPVQNIGAYGVEVKDSITQVNGLYIETGESFSFTADQCQFGYRQSIFKEALKGKVVLTSVVFKLLKNAPLNLSYGPVKEAFDQSADQTIKGLRSTIINIRKSKLPEPEEFGNAGSFFKNPVVEKSIFQALNNNYPGLAFYPVDDSSVKLPAGWLIDQAGWKGKQHGGAAVHARQALVLINKNNASVQDITELYQLIIADIKSKFGIELEPEVNII